MESLNLIKTMESLNYYFNHKQNYFCLFIFIFCFIYVESLFTNVPLEETIDILVEKIFKDKKSTFHGLKYFQFRDLTIIATQQPHFQFLGIIL